MSSRRNGSVASYRTLFCGLRWPLSPGHSGGEVRDFNLIRSLLALGSVRFFAVWPTLSAGQSDPLRDRLDGFHCPAVEDRARARSSWVTRALLRLQTRRWPVIGPVLHGDVASHLGAARALTPALQDAIETGDPDFVFVSPQVNPVAQTVRAGSARARRVLASYDVEAVRIERFMSAARGFERLALRMEVARARAFERENLSRFDGVVAVSDLDASIYRDRYAVPAERILVLENGVDLGYFAFQERRQSEETPIVIFTGAMSYEPNDHAARRLIDKIMPLVRRRHQAKSLIVGREPGKELMRRHDGLFTIVTGGVDDVRPYLASAAVTCVPLMAGSGTKIKVLEALSAGVPVVCSPLAAEGLAARHDEHVLIAESDEALADAICRLLDDLVLATRLAVHGRKLIEARYAWDLCMKPLGGWLQNLRDLPARFS